MLRQYTVKRDVFNFTYFDLSGYGKEGNIEGIEYDELPDLMIEIGSELKEVDLRAVIEELELELSKRQ